MLLFRASVSVSIAAAAIRVALSPAFAKPLVTVALAPVTSGLVRPLAVRVH